MNRNIVTYADAARQRNRQNRGDSKVGPAEGRVEADDYLSRLVKYVPIEIIGAYITISGILHAAYSGSSRAISLGVLLIASLVVVGLYCRRVLNIARRSQVIVSMTAFVVWVFATGGVFAYWSWYAPWTGSVAMISFGLLAKIVKVPPLDEELMPSDSIASRANRFLMAAARVLAGRSTGRGFGPRLMRPLSL